MYDGRPTSHLYTVRLWPEPAAEGETRWRGQVTHVLSGETRYFREWPALLDFLSASLANPELDRPTPVPEDTT